MSGGPKKVVQAAKARVRQRLAEQAGVRATSRSDARSVWTAKEFEIATSIAAALNVEIAHLPRREILATILRVHKDDLPDDIQRLLPSVGLTNWVDPFALDLLALVEKTIGRDRNKLNCPLWTPRPTNEDEWVERIMGATLDDLVVALSA